MIQIHTNKKDFNTYIIEIVYTTLYIKICLKYEFHIVLFLESLNMLDVNMVPFFPTVMTNRGRVETALQ